MSDLPTLQAVLAPDEEPHDPEAVPPSGEADCPNCGTRLRGRYCHACGQIDQPLRMPVHRFLAQSFTEFLGLDGRVWKTLGVLLFKPGKLTNSYLTGRRRQYLRPLRVYLSSTLLFFFLLSVLDPVGQIRDALAEESVFADSTLAAGALVAELDREIGEENREAERQRVLVDSLQTRFDRLVEAFRADSLAGRLGDPGAVEDARSDIEDAADDLEDEADRLQSIDGSIEDRRLEWQREQVARFPADSLVRPADLAAASELVIRDESESEGIEFGNETVDGWLARGRAYEQLKNARTSEDRLEAGVDLARTAIGKVPVVLFLMLPIFALLLKVVYVRRGWFYSEHLVFGLHTHAFAFLVFSMIAGLAAVGSGEAVWTGVLAVVLYLSIPVYFLVAQRRVYGQGWIKTLVKASVLGWTYLLVLTVFGLTLTVLLAFLG